MNDINKKKSFLTEIIEAFTRGYNEQDLVIKERMYKDDFAEAEMNRRAAKQNSHQLDK